jgi:hypothetical protein
MPTAVRGCVNGNVVFYVVLSFRLLKKRTGVRSKRFQPNVHQSHDFAQCGRRRDSFNGGRWEGTSVSSELHPKNTMISAATEALRDVPDAS